MPILAAKALQCCIVLSFLLKAWAGSALTLAPGAEWPTRDIAVCWVEPDRTDRRERQTVRRVLRMTWERESAIRFTGWHECRPGDPAVHVNIRAESPKTAKRGAHAAGHPDGVILPPLSRLARPAMALQIVVHEFGHVLGFGHEFARHDMPEELVTRCIRIDRYGRRFFEEDRLLTPFDRRSVMVGCIDTADTDLISPVPRLSPADIMGLVRTYGSHPDSVLDEDEPGDHFGAAIEARDVDEDGLIDLLVSAPGEDSGKGAVYVYRGTRQRGLRPWRRMGADEWIFATRTGPVDMRTIRSLANVPGIPALDETSAVDSASLDIDLDGDGLIDRVLGLPHADGGARDSGAVVILHGSANGRFEPWYWFGQRN